MAQASADSSDICKLYEYGERLNAAKDKSAHASDFEAIMRAAAAEDSSVKVKQLAAQFIPKFVNYFPSLSCQALDQYLYFLEEEDLGVRIHAIRGLPLFSKENPENVYKIVDNLVPYLHLIGAYYILHVLDFLGENAERDAMHRTLMSLLRQDIKSSLTVLFKYIGSTEEANTDEAIREKVLRFVKDKVFPLKEELLKPQEEMERHITDLVKKSLQDVTGAEFKMFLEFLKSLSLFGPDAPVESFQELAEIIEEQADLDARFNVSDGDHFNRLISCLHIAIPYYKLPEEQKSDLLRSLADCSAYVTPQDSRRLLPSIVKLLKEEVFGKKCRVRYKPQEMKFSYVECLLFTFHHLAHKIPNATNSLCGYKIVTGQPSDRLGEDFSERHKDFIERLRIIDDLTKTMLKKLNRGMEEHTKAIAAARTDEETEIRNKQQQNSLIGIKTCENILAMIQPLHSKSPSFIGDQRINLSWKQEAKSSEPSTAPVFGQKRASAPVTAGPSSTPIKKGRVDLQSRLVSRAVESAHRSCLTRGEGDGCGERGWGRSRRGRARGRGRGR
ncbi:hypothetical protein NMG60_11003377 [Bertholletia excelsa]